MYQVRVIQGFTGLTAERGMVGSDCARGGITERSKGCDGPTRSFYDRNRDILKDCAAVELGRLGVLKGGDV
jgi:hypothetical protein